MAPERAMTMAWCRIRAQVKLFFKWCRMGVSSFFSFLFAFLLRQFCVCILSSKFLTNGVLASTAAGTSSGDGLAGCLNQADANGAAAFYRAARIYNSGSIAPSGNLDAGIATHCYASDIANRLTGWVEAPHACFLDG